MGIYVDTMVNPKNKLTNSIEDLKNIQIFLYLNKKMYITLVINHLNQYGTKSIIYDYHCIWKYQTNPYVWDPGIQIKIFKVIHLSEKLKGY